MTYRDLSPEAEAQRLKSELEEVTRDRDALRRRMWLFITVVLGAIPPALVVRFHVPNRVLLLDVLGFAIWGWFLLKVSRRG